MSVAIKKSSALNKLNLTPMIDVVFQLVLFLLVATRFDDQEREMDLVLAQSDEAMARIAKPKELFVNVDRDGKIVLNSRQLSSAELLAQLRQAQANNPGRQTVIIRADERCDWKFVVAVMDACVKAQIRDYRATIAPRSG